MIKKAIVEALRQSKVVNLELVGNTIQATIMVPEIGMVEQKNLEDLKLLLCNKVKQGLNFQDNSQRFMGIQLSFDSSLTKEDTFIPDNLFGMTKFFNTLVLAFKPGFSTTNDNYSIIPQDELDKDNPFEE